MEATLAAVDGAVLNADDLPAGPHSATRVLVGRGKDLYRVYVHPQTLAVLKIVPESERLTRLLFYLHGELLRGRTGSMLVELAASWTIVMILTRCLASGYTVTSFEGNTVNATAIPALGMPRAATVGMRVRF